MNTLKLIILLLLPISAIGQLEISGRIVDAESKEGLKNATFYLIKGGDKWIDITTSRDEGYFKLRVKNDDIDTSSTYHIEFSGGGYLDKLYPIDPFAYADDLVIELEKNSNITPQNPDLTYSWCLSTSFGRYHPKVPRSMQDLPDSIRIRVERHLIDRLGKDFYQKISLTSGQIVDLKRLSLVEDYAKEYRWTPYSYYLCFTFRDETLGIGQYSAKMVLDSAGNVVEEIELPNVAKSPSKAKLISKEEAIQIARQKYLFTAYTQISLGYDRQQDCITWRFKFSDYRPNHTVSSKTLIINAHTGEKVGYGHSGGIWD